MTVERGPTVVHLRNGGTSVVLDTSGPSLPGIAYWGRDLGELDEDALAGVLATTAPAAIGSQPDEPVRLALLPEHAMGWLGRPGLEGSHADGSGWAPVFTVEAVETGRAEDGSQRAAISAVARDLRLLTELELSQSGLLRARHTLTNDSSAAYEVRSLAVALPVPARATELLDFTGRWARERSPQRQAFTVGTWLRESRGGRGGHESPTLLIAGTPGFDFGNGEVWGVHIGWSGNSVSYAERTPGGLSVLAAAELLHPSEVVLGPAERYVAPWLYAAYSSHGLDAMSASLHRWLRARPSHPSMTRRPRPVTLNVWEAVYFDHDLARLRALAQLAADVGVERFVLDDGWFRGRRDDTAGLGDWYVDPDVWPDGLHPLVEVVAGHGLEFGLWFEPEMVNANSDLARTHPDWLLGASSGLPRDQRNQQVLDLGRRGAYGYLLERIDALLSEYAVGYVKWDHNRHLVAASTAGGRAGVHAQTLAVYRLLDELRRRHPGVEFESCASGGGRIDFGILERTDRVWTSDCNDALERQSIQRWTGLLLPPELMGTHVGPTRSHTTGRTHDLSFRAATALFGSFGIEWDITGATPDDIGQLREWIDLYKRHRSLLHSGDVVRADVPDPALWLHGVVAADRSEALYAWVRIATSVTESAGPVQLPGLVPDAAYRVSLASPGPALRRLERMPLAIHDGVTASGGVLGSVGLQLPGLQPEQAVLLHAVRVT